MTEREEMRLTVAQAFLEAACMGPLGVTVKLSHKSDDPVPLYATASDETDDYQDYSKMKAEVATKTFSVPLQNNFSGEVRVGDTIYWAKDDSSDDGAWQVTKYKSDSLGAVYKLTATLTTARDL